jgi:hypothetical protein
VECETLPHLITGFFTDYPPFNDGHVTIVKKCPNLEKLSVLHCYISLYSPQSIRCFTLLKRLTHLILENFNANLSICESFAGLKSLTHLKLIHFKDFSECESKHLFLSLGKALSHTLIEVLVFIECSVTAYFTDLILRGVRIRRLIIKTSSALFASFSQVFSEQRFTASDCNPTSVLVLGEQKFNINGDIGRCSDVSRFIQ